MAVAGRYGEKHPRFIAINLAVDQTRDKLQRALNVSVGQIRMEYELAVSEEAQLMQEFEAQKRVAMNLDLDSVNYNVLQREAGTIRNLYESLLKQEKELSVVGTSRTNNVRLMERAMVPGQPYSPDRSLDRFTAVTTGLLFSVGFVVLLERVNNKIRNPDELRRGLGIPVFGFVPAVPGNTTAVLSDESPHELVESLRSIRTTLIVTADTKNHAPVIAVTSTHPLEGKTTTACSLALTLAQGGSRVLLMDADLRRPSVHKALNLKNRQGLTEMLSQTATPREVISRTDEPNLFVTTAGAVYENPPELLGSSRMKEFLEHVSTGHFDWVILDTPPVLAVTDALLLAPLVSAVAFVVLADSTPVPHARQALALLHEVQAGPVVGAILNRVETAKPGYGYERYYGRRYDSYYGAQAA
jgi:succinoglycan biosynthesis transport protein ExoP